MLRVPLFSRFGVSLLILVVALPATADDDLDPAFQQSQPQGPLAIVPENYLRSEWITRYVYDVTGYLDAHPPRPLCDVHVLRLVSGRTKTGQ